MKVSEIITEESLQASILNATRVTSSSEFADYALKLQSNSIITEGVYYNKDLLIEAELYENFLDSAKQYLGAKINSTVDDIKGAITDLTAAGIVIKDIVQNPEYLKKVLDRLNLHTSKLLGSITTLASKNQTIANLWNQIKAKINSFMRSTGWKGFLSILGAYGFMKFIVDHVSDLKNDVIQALMDKIDIFGQILPTVTMGGFMQFFDGLVFVKKYFLDILTQAKKDIEQGNLGRFDLARE